MPLLRLIYVSRVTTALSPLALQQLQALSERNNRRQDITGALGHTGRYFIQCIEGRSEDMALVMARIRKDGRHTEVLDLCSSDTDKRLFGQWSMRLFDSHALDDDVHLTHQAGQRDPDRAKLLIERMTQALQPGQTLHRL